METNRVWVYAAHVERETRLRARLFEVENAMDGAREHLDATALLAELAVERDEIRAKLDAMLPEDAELGYQGAERPFSKTDHDGKFMPRIGESGSGGLG